MISSFGLTKVDALNSECLALCPYTLHAKTINYPSAHGFQTSRSEQRQDQGLDYAVQRLDAESLCQRQRKQYCDGRIAEVLLAVLRD